MMSNITNIMNNVVAWALQENTLLELECFIRVYSLVLMQLIYSSKIS